MYRGGKLIEVSDNLRDSEIRRRHLGQVVVVQTPHFFAEWRAGCRISYVGPASRLAKLGSRIYRDVKPHSCAGDAVGAKRVPNACCMGSWWSSVWKLGPAALLRS
jgi:hypothetical protein